MILFVGVLYLLEGPGLGLEPGTTAWWNSRVIWVLILALLLVPVALGLSPLERRPRDANAAVPSPVRQIAGAMMLCLGVALLAMYGYGGGPVPRLDLASFLLVIAGAGISGLLPPLRSRAT
jgi:hypothetical protein